MMKWFGNLLLGLVILPVMLGIFTGCNHQKPDSGMIDTLAIDLKDFRKHPDADREV